MICITHIYKSAEEKESAIDRVFAYMDRNKINIEDYRVQTFYPESDKIVLKVFLGIKIQYRPGIEDDIKSWLVPV